MEQINKEKNKKSNENNIKEEDNIQCTDEYKEILKNEIKQLQDKIKKYLPQKHFKIVSTFMHIHRKIVHHYEKMILKSFKNLENAYFSFGEEIIQCTDEYKEILNNEIKQLHQKIH